MFKSSSLQHRFLVALFASSHSRAELIFSCNGSSLSNSPTGMTLGWWPHACHLQCLWHGWLEQWVSNVTEAGGATWRHLHDDCHQGRDSTVHPSDLKGSSVSLVEGRASSATNGGWLLGILCLEVGVEDAGKAYCIHSNAPWMCRLRAVVMSWGSSMVSAREGVAPA